MQFEKLAELGSERSSTTEVLMSESQVGKLGGLGIERTAAAGGTGGTEAEAVAPCPHERRLSGGSCLSCSSMEAEVAAPLVDIGWLRLGQMAEQLANLAAVRLMGGAAAEPVDPMTALERAHSLVAGILDVLGAGGTWTATHYEAELARARARGREALAGLGRVARENTELEAVARETLAQLNAERLRAADAIATLTAQLEQEKKKTAYLLVAGAR